MLIGTNHSCRVAVAGTHVVDYVGSRPDATTEAALDRILDQPLPTWDPEVTGVYK